MFKPFNLDNSEDYLRWRDNKFEHLEKQYRNDTPPVFCIFSDGQSPSQSEINHLLAQCRLNSLGLYRIENNQNFNHQTAKKMVLNLAKKLGLERLDGNICADRDNLTSITNTEHKGQHEYIPYSTKRLSWHTDGYYNTPDRTINSMLLHCHRDAKNGGESLFMDHEIAYILLRDENPDYIRALSEKDVMTIPANVLDGKVIRDRQTGPVFSQDSQGQLHMRYTARKRNIEWKQKSPTLEAVTFLEELLQSDSKYIIKHTLKPGEGIICRNVLHCRTAYEDYDDEDKKRLLFRGRYYDELPAKKSASEN